MVTKCEPGFTWQWTVTTVINDVIKEKTDDTTAETGDALTPTACDTSITAIATSESATDTSFIDGTIITASVHDE